MPQDSVLLPLFEGALLVSREHATFCRIPSEELELAQAVVREQSSIDVLSESTLSALRTHGFFDDPRSASPESRSVQLQLTNACNLACSYCCTNSGLARKGELEPEHWFGILDDVKRSLGTGVRVAMLGGEPFVVPYAIDVAEYAVALGLSFTIFSNGLYFEDKALAKRVAALLRKGAELRISLAGPTRETCDEASGAPRFDRVISGIHVLHSFDAMPVLDLMLMPQLVDEVAVHLPELRKKLPPGMKICLGVLFHGGRESGERLFSSRAELEAALDKVAFEAGESISAEASKPLADRREGCTCALGHHLHVRSDGALFTCFKMEERVGDLKSQSFESALEKVQHMPAPATTLPKCKECPLATLCGGGCRAENIQFTGDPEVPICDEWRVRVLCELLAEDRSAALEWPASHLLTEARARGINAPEKLVPILPSRHLIDL
jgi:radical SAM protein with 4Fe4S-binding SPASM domain